MRKTALNLFGSMKRFPAFGRTAPLLALVALCLTGASKKHEYSPREKAFYADASAVEFVRPGLTITINSAQIAFRRDYHSRLHADRPEWASAGCGRGHYARNDQPGLHRGSVAERSGRVYGLHNTRQFRAGSCVDESTGSRFWRRHDQYRAGAISVRFQP